MTSHLGCVLIDFKLIPEMIFRKMGCLVVTSNSVKLKSISSWPNLRAKTTENHFRFHFHFKWFLVLENRREREREREREGERKKRSRHHRHRAVRWHYRHRTDRDLAFVCSDLMIFFLGFVCVLRNEWYYIFVW